MNFKTPRIGAKLHFKTTTMTTAAAKATPVVDLGGLRLTSVSITTAWTDGDLELFGSINSSSTGSMMPVFGSVVGGSVGSTVRVFASFKTTADRLTTIDPRLTDGLQYIMLKASVAQGSSRVLTLGLS